MFLLYIIIQKYSSYILLIFKNNLIFRLIKEFFVIIKTIVIDIILIENYY